MATSHKSSSFRSVKQSILIINLLFRNRDLNWSFLVIGCSVCPLDYILNESPSCHKHMTCLPHRCGLVVG